MKFSTQLIFGTIEKRYKRFFADITLKTGETVVAHVANTGSMKSCWEPGWRAAVTKTDDPARKLQYSLQMVHNGQSWIGVNTALPNHIVHEALKAKKITELKKYNEFLPEQKINEKTRLDFMIKQEGLPDCALEVKNVTLKDGDAALFPDAVSTRGQKHLEELIELKEKGLRAVIFFLIQREDIKFFSPAALIDPTYAKLLVKAKNCGVEILAYGCSLNENEITLNKPVEIKL
jgi:sugar fermentation stimulation protein A